MESKKSRWYLRLWAAVRQVLSIRGLLQWFGLWNYLVAAVTALASLALATWAYIRGLTAPEIAFIGIASFALLIFVGAVIFSLLHPRADTDWRKDENDASHKPESLRQRTLRLVDDLSAFLREQGPMPPHPLSGKGSEERQRRVFNAYFDWQKDTYYKYMAYYRDRVVQIDRELAAHQIFTKLTIQDIDPPEMNGHIDVKKIAEALVLAAHQLLADDTDKTASALGVPQLTDRDPRVNVTILDERAASYPQTPFVLENQGKETAHSVQVQPVKFRSGIAEFNVVDSIGTGKHETVVPKVASTLEYQYLSHRNIVPLLEDEGGAVSLVTLADFNGPIVVKGIVEYTDYTRKPSFETSFEIVFWAQRDSMKANGLLLPKNQPSIEVRNVNFRRLK